ncbi:Ktr system potassium transporter B [Bacillus sp. FJAT-27916]|uniref:TrkH family potassium uptake protein n=1 Tax=Bacillus sp. FJAT-27916 TaxID=1679169 RepID=UPI0006712232|nr:TrkH family potassium uptake protein [Bacillus sp. FJAT-27916]KMY44048.1 Ktr system potassium transporter B [Bacillus sp. FJAT-27916]
MNHSKWETIQLTPPQVLALGFALVILLGTVLLKLPISTKVEISWMDAFFTAASATTVTGLSVINIGTTLSVFGECVMIVMMQIGGLGLMTFAIFVLILLGKKIGLKERLIVQESFNQTSIGGVIRLVKILFIFTIAVELAGTVILSLKWIPVYGAVRGVFYSLFHSVSAFNNAGFSLFSDNLMGYSHDGLVNLVITLLIITGGLGFTVLVDLANKRNFKNLKLHSKIMLIGTFVLNVTAILFLFLLEYSNEATIGSMPLGEKLWVSYFQGISPRTAGFNTIDIGGMTDGSLLLIMLLMFIGAGSASTGSGIKVTTFIVIVWSVFAYIRGRKEPVMFERTIHQTVVFKSLAVMMIGLFFVFLTAFLLTVTEDASLSMILFESFSAFGTVGLSMGLTPDLSNAGRLLIIILMFIGRIGPLTLAFSFARTRTAKIRYPEEDIFIG